jgi:hypothetical protein
MPGFDTAGRVQSVWPTADREFGSPRFWIRYFTPSPFATVVNGDPVTECQAIWNSGGHFLGPTSEPTQSRLDGSATEGRADAESFVSALTNVYHAVGPLLLPSSGVLVCFLGQETSTSLSLGYWNGWAGYINGAEFPPGSGQYPLYAGLYCNPGSPYPNCSTVGASGAAYCYGIWSSEPEPCGDLANPPAWAPEECAAVGTVLWQYGEQHACGYIADVDLDEGEPGNDPVNHMFYLDAYP